MLQIALAGLLCGASYADDPLYLADMGVTAELPAGWSVPKWGDWYLDAVDNAKTTQVHLEYTYYQVTPTPDAARAWAEQAVTSLKEQHSDVQILSATVEGGEAAIEIEYKYEGAQPAVYRQRSFPIAGKVAHLSATGLKRNARKVEPAIEVWRGALQIGKPAEEIAAGGPVSSEAGFTAILPEGWRLPLDSEINEVRKFAARGGQGKLDREICWGAIRPHYTGDTRMAMGCQAGMYLGVLDEHSFEGEEAAFREAFFSTSASEVAPAEPYPTADRLSMVYALPESHDLAIRMAVTPYEKGLLLTYAMGRPADGAELDGALRAILDQTSFSGEGGGQPPLGLWAWIDYSAKYRPELLAAGVAPILLFFGFIVMKARSRKPSWEDEDG